MYGEVETFTDNPTKKFKEKQMKGMIINTAMAKTLDKRVFVPSGSWSSFYVSSGSCTGCGSTSTLAKSWSGTGLPPGFPLPTLAYACSTAFASSMTNARKDAVTKAYAGVDKPEVLALVDIAEFKKTMQMLRNPIAGLGRLTDRIKRDMRRKAPKEGWPKGYSLSDFVRDNWLQYRYGYLPLIGTIQGIYAAVTKPAVPLRRTSRGKSVVPPETISFTSNTTIGAPVGTGCGWNVTQTVKDTFSFEVRAGVLYESTFTVSDDLGLNLQAIPSTIWELVPYSFVSDWFINFGTWLDAVTPRVGVRYLASWAVEKTGYTGLSTLTTSTFDTSTCYGVSGTPGWTFAREVSEKRRFPDVSPSLTTRFYSIDLEKDLWFKRLIDAFAQAHGGIGRMSKTARV